MTTVLLGSSGVHHLLGSPTINKASSYTPEPDPGPSPSCPSDMRLVQRRHFREVEHICTDFHEDTHRCWAYYPHFTVAHGEPTPMRFCMDPFEAPNQQGAKPMVMLSYDEATLWCSQRGKRLCTEFEWESACESGEERPWFYGWSLDGGVCNSSKRWKPFDANALMAGGERAKKETERLWQGSGSGDYAACRTDDGIYDMMGNVEEWVVSSRTTHRYPGVLMSGFWAKPWVGCRGTNDAHEPNFRFYEVGFRCCADPRLYFPVL